MKIINRVWPHLFRFEWIDNGCTTARKVETFEYEVGAKETLQVNGNPIETVRLKPKDAKARQSIEVRQAVNNQNLPVNVRIVDRKGTVTEQVAANIRFE